MTPSNTKQIPSAAPAGNPEYWDALINEREAAKFVCLSVRTLQALRVRGGGSRYVRVSARCIRYRRRDLIAWAESMTRVSTSDVGTQAAE